MANSSRIRVGIVGASARRDFASIAHIPALRGPPSGVCKNLSHLVAAPSPSPVIRRRQAFDGTRTRTGR